MTAAAAIIFFAYIGFDAVSTGSEEARNPARDLPLAIIGSLVICTIFYVLTAVGALGIATPGAAGGERRAAGRGAGRGRRDQLGGVRSWRSARSSRSPAWCWSSCTARPASSSPCAATACCRSGWPTVNQRYGTPARLTIGLGMLIAILAALVPLSEIVKLVNIGTLFAFVLVNIGVIILRRTRPEMPRPYRVPWSPVLPILGVLFAVYLMTDLPLGHLDPVRGLAGAGHRHLLRLRLPPLPGAPGRHRRTGTGEPGRRRRRAAVTAQ